MLVILEKQLGKHPVRVFTFRGQPIENANNRTWRAALIRAGIENFRWHDLRHTWATWHRQSGTPTHELQRLGAWQSSAMVERYAHVVSDALMASAGRLESFVSGYDWLRLPQNENGLHCCKPLQMVPGTGIEPVQPFPADGF